MSEKPFTVERAAVIPVPPERVWPLLADFHEWRQWSPWDKDATGLERRYDGPERGVGARYAWAGKKEGEGSMEILSADEPRHLDIRLLFTKPWKAENRTAFLLEPVSSGTRVTWRMTGTQGTVSRLFFSVFRMNDRLGRDFEKGLADLRRAATEPA